MRLSRGHFRSAPVALALALALTGCIENMDDLKETLGFQEPPPPAPVYQPPVAKAQANATEALVGATISFVSDGTKDPQKLPLDYEWDFADGRRAHGADASHAYATPGEYAVKLRVTNLGGLADEDVVLVRILPADQPPAAAIRVLDGKGVATTRVDAGAALTFDALASDPEGAPLAHEWDFGDGSTSHEASATHVYAKPGRYTARLDVVDRAGNAATATASIAVDLRTSASGAFDATGASQADVPVHVARGARSLELALTFPAGAGLHDLEIVVLDAEGREVARTAGEPEPGASGDATRALTVDEPESAGEWTVRVLRERGLAIEWSLAIVETT